MSLTLRDYCNDHGPGMFMLEAHAVIDAADMPPKFREAALSVLAPVAHNLAPHNVTAANLLIEKVQHWRACNSEFRAALDQISYLLKVAGEPGFKTRAMQSLTSAEL